MEKYNVNSKVNVNKSVKSENIISKIYSHNSEEMVICYIGKDEKNKLRGD